MKLMDYFGIEKYEIYKHRKDIRDEDLKAMISFCKQYLDTTVNNINIFNIFKMEDNQKTIKFILSITKDLYLQKELFERLSLFMSSSISDEGLFRLFELFEIYRFIRIQVINTDIVKYIVLEN